MPVHPDDRSTVEALIDSQGLPRVVAMLSEICADKAEHVATNWQDAPTAKWWMEQSKTLEACFATIDEAERVG